MADSHTAGVALAGLAVFSVAASNLTTGAVAVLPIVPHFHTAVGADAGAVVAGMAAGSSVVAPARALGVVQVGGQNAVVVLDQTLRNRLVAVVIGEDHIVGSAGNGHGEDIVAHRGHLGAGPCFGVGGGPSAGFGPGVGVDIAPLGSGVVIVQRHAAGGRLGQVAVVAVAVD